MRPLASGLSAVREAGRIREPVIGVTAFAWSAARADAGAFASRCRARRQVAEGVAMIDLIIVCVASAVAYLLRYGAEVPPLENVATTLLALVLHYKAMGVANACNPGVRNRVLPWIRRAAQAWTSVFIIMICLVYLTKAASAYSRIWVVSWYGLALLGFAINRIAFSQMIKRWVRLGHLARTVAVVDLTGSGERLACRIQKAGGADVHLVGLFAGEGRGRSSVEDLIALSRLFRIDEIMVTVARDVGEEVNALIRRLATVPTNVLLCPDLPELVVPPSGAGFWLGTTALTVQRRPIHGWNGLAKRAEDVALTSVLTLLALPIMGLVALAIKLDSRGPVFFRQKRLGFNNNVFLVWKFRSMIHQAAQGGQQGEGEVKQASRGDPRVTRVGRFLRRTSLDELPQLFNILRGEMSLVGPRPHALSHNDFYAAQIDDYLGRHRVLPGLTGLAQVNGLRGETDTLDKMRQRIEQDLKYIESWSLFLDLKIIARTVLLVVSQKNAY